MRDKYMNLKKKHEKIFYVNIEKYFLEKKNLNAKQWNPELDKVSSPLLNFKIPILYTAYLDFSTAKAINLFHTCIFQSLL
jgi:hypothetical protein